MFVKKLAAAILAVMAVASSALAQSPTRIEQFKAWGAYFYKGDTGKVCYVLTVPDPKQLTPAKVDHGEVFFLVTQRPGQNISYEPQAMLGYDPQAGSKVTVTVDARQFVMFTKGRSAWLENAAEEPALVAAMRSGKAMSMGAVSKKGTKTGYVFSLSGISAALKKIENCQ
jgi:Invasion associated locus B (IalB) protein